MLLENFQSVSRNLRETIFEIFRYNSQNFRKYFAKFSAIILEKFSGFFLIFSNYFSKLLVIFLDTKPNFSKLSKIVYNIVLTSRTRVYITSHSVLERIVQGCTWYRGIPVTSCFVGCIVSKPTSLFVITLVRTNN